MLKFKRSTLLIAFLAFAIFSVGIVIWIMLSITKIDERERSNTMAELNEANSAIEGSAVDEIERSDEAHAANSIQIVKPKLPFNVKVVYSDSYLIDLGGAESLHPFDIKKYQKFIRRC